MIYHYIHETNSVVLVWRRYSRVHQMLRLLFGVRTCYKYYDCLEVAWKAKHMRQNRASATGGEGEMSNDMKVSD